MTRTDYNGWTNYETWVVNLWIDNEEGSYTYWREVAAEATDIAELSGALKDYHEEALPEVEGFAADLLGAAMSEVNWDEIAAHLIEEVAEED